jgi:biopolymer transport protein TolR
VRLNYHGWTKTAVKWPNHFLCRANVYPLTGIAVTLLVAFMLGTASTPHHYGYSTDLPVSRFARQMPKALREDAQIVSVTRDGKIYFGHTPMVAEDLPDMIRERLKNGTEKKVYLRADARAKYGDVKLVLTEIRQAGIENVCILAEKRER